LIGGYVTTEFSWRYVFAGEVVIVIAVLLFRRRMKPAPPAARKPKLDVVGAALSALGFGLAVFGILMSSTWGWVQPKDSPTIGGHELTPFGFSLVPFLIFGGFVFLTLFKSWEERRERQGKDVLLQRSLLRIPTLNAGLETLGMMQLVLLGTFFVLPVFLQVVLGLNAFDTGKRLFPMSISMLIAALAGPRLAGRLSPKRVCQAGLGAMTLAALVLMGTIDVELHGTTFALSLILFGIGAGLLMSQVGNVIMSSAPPESANEAGGLQGTAQNLGASLGTALIGAILLTSLTSSFVSRVSENPALPQDVRTSITAKAEKGIDIVPVDQVQQAAVDAGLPPSQAEALATDYGNAQLDGLKRALLGVALLAAAGLYFTRRLPSKPLDPAAPA
jgi:predicted MFS family arabinose efflux permease